MIRLVNEIPDFLKLNSEWVKIKCLYEAYRDDDKVLFWIQDNNKAVISMTDGNMIIFYNGGDVEEIRTFVDVMNPACVFSDYDTLLSINRKPKEKINVMYRKADVESKVLSDNLKSDEIYSLLDTKGLSLPEYPYFAVDYCRRLNMGKADCFAIKNKCAAVSFNCGNMAIMNGISAKEKGYGTVALKGILYKNKGRDFLVCCRDSVKGFYDKNDFSFLYFAGYWVKNNEYK